MLEIDAGFNVDLCAVFTVLHNTSTKASFRITARLAIAAEVHNLSLIKRIDSMSHPIFYPARIWRNFAVQDLRKCVVIVCF